MNINTKILLSTVVFILGIFIAFSMQETWSKAGWILTGGGFGALLFLINHKVKSAS